MSHNKWIAASALIVVLVMLASSMVALGSASGSSTTPAAAGSTVPVTVPLTSTSAPAVASSTCDLTPNDTSNLLTTANDPSWNQFVQHTNAIGASAVAAGLPASDLHLPYTGAIPAQNINGVPETGTQIASQVCPDNNAIDPAPAPAGIAYNGQSETAAGHVVNNHVIDSTSVLGILNVNSSSNFYPNSATPTQWGAQLNVVMANITILGHRGDAFWVQNVVSYDSHNDTISFVDDTWNFTTSSSEMEQSSLVSWSPNGSSYTGVWVAFSPYFYAPPPFTASVYVNSSVNSMGDQVLWYNYSVASHGHFYHGSYDNLVIASQANPLNPQPIVPAYFEASAVTKHEVNEGYEFDAMIGADDGSNQLMLSANATEQLEYYNLTSSAYANVPAAVNFGSQTGEQTVGIAVNYVGTTAYLSGGPLIEHGLWNYTGQAGVASGNTKVLNAISVSGSPVAISAQPYVFVFLENAAITSQGYQWAPDVPAWYLMPGTYNYELMLSDYAEQTGTIVVSSSTVTLTATLPYSAASGVYTPLWAFNNAQVAGISSSGTGAIGSQYVLFNNPTNSCTACGSAPNANLSAVFYSVDDYSFESFPGIFLNGTSAYIDVNAPPSFCVHTATSRGANTYYYLNIEFFYTSHVTLSNAAAIGGWPAQEEISFYITVPASQNPAPQGNVYVWNSTGDLIMSNHFVAAKPGSGDVSPDELVLYGGTNNVVWGNTFRDPLGVALGSSYAGIGLAESGDLIYNNNFSVDNPVVYLPYNFPNVADCLPQCEQSNLSDGWFYNYPHDTWNVTPQPAANVAETVNGYALSGNVMGSSYTVQGGPTAPTQGGNFYWNFGTSPNNRSTLPYVDRFFYSDWSNIYPLGCPSVQSPGGPCGTAPAVVGAYENGIQFGGDSAPIVPFSSYRVTFTESGLPVGQTWYVNVTGETPLSATGATTSLSLNLGNGTYSFTVATGNKSWGPSYSSPFVVNGGPVTVPVTFTLVTYSVSFSESGLPSGLTWMVTFNGVGMSTLTNGGTDTLSFAAVINGTYSYTIAPNAGWHQSSIPYSGTIVVSGSAVSESVTYTQVTYAVTFSESGLPSGLTWMVTVNGVPQQLTTNGGTDSLVFPEANGTYSYTIAGNPGWHQATLHYSGSVTVSGASVTEPTLVYTKVTYSVTFKESGLPSGLTWTVTLNGTPMSLITNGGTDSLVFQEANGTLPYAITGISGWHQTTLPYSGSVVVNGAAVTEPTLKYKLVTYSVTFKESGLPSGLNWTVTVDSHTLYLTTTGGTDSLVFTGLVNGTYSYSVTGNAGWHQTTLPYSGSVTVSGASVVEPTLKYKQVMYSVTFSESGIRSGLTWRVTLNGHTMSLTTNGGTDSVTFSEANGTYNYSITSPNGWVQSTLPTSGTVTVNGASVNEPTCVYTKV